jgi:type I restriction enzyme M protein
MRRSLGEKRREISDAQIQQVTEIYQSFEESERSKIFETIDLGYRKITVERPLRLNFQASPERIARLDEQTAFLNLAKSKKRNAEERAAEEDRGRQQQEAVKALLATLPSKVFMNRGEFEAALESSIQDAKALNGPLFGQQAVDVKITGPLKKAILSALSERDERADICEDKNGEPEPDPELRDHENVPLKESVDSFFQREISPHVPDAWINTTIRDHKDGEIGKVGYEINFNRYFYTYQPPRPLEEIERDIKELEAEILQMLRAVAG